MICLGNDPRSFCCFWDYTQVLHFRLFCWLWGLLHFFYGILAHSNRYNGHLNLVYPFPSLLVHWFLRCWCPLLASPIYHFRFTLVKGSNIPGLRSIAPYHVTLFFYHRHTHNWPPLLLWPSLLILSGANFPSFPSIILDICQPVGLSF